MTNQTPMLVPSDQEMKSYGAVARTAANTPYWQKLGGEPGILSIMLMARELGISPMNAISGMFNVIQGKVEISGKGMAYLIRKAGHKLHLIVLNKEVCRLKGIRKDTGEEMEASYTLDEARASNLIKPGGAWIKVPEDMLYWRALSRLARRLFTDCIGGCYVEGELQEMVEKKPVTQIESPELEEAEVEEVKMELPEGVSEGDLETYLQLLSDQYQKGKDEICARAKSNPEEFWKKFFEWKESLVEEEVMTVVEEKGEETVPF